MSDRAAPATYHVGVGLSDAVDAAELIALVERALLAAGRPAVFSIGTIETRREHPAIGALALHFGRPVVGFSAVMLEAQTSRLLNPSDAVFARTGCHGVAEAAALASAGPAGLLVVGKLRSARATVAVAVA